MRAFIFLTLLGLVGYSAALSNDTDITPTIECKNQHPENSTANDKDQFQLKCEKAAIDIHASLMQEKDLHESQLLEQICEGNSNDISDDAYTYIMLYHMNEDSIQLPRRSELMRGLRMQLSKTEQGTRILSLMDKEAAVREAIRLGNDEKALVLNSQLISDYNDFANVSTSTNSNTFQTVLSLHAEFRDAFLRAERGDSQAKDVYLVETQDNPYQEGQIGMLQCGGMPSINSPLFINTIGKQLQDTMSLAEIYKLIQHSLGKAAIPYIFAIKTQGNCVSEYDEKQVHDYVQLTTNLDGTYSDPEAAFLLATYLWGNSTDNPAGITSDFRKWKEGYMMIMMLAYQNDERAIIFIMNHPLLRKALED